MQKIKSHWWKRLGIDFRPCTGHQACLQGILFLLNGNDGDPAEPKHRFKAMPRNFRIGFECSACSSEWVWVFYHSIWLGKTSMILSVIADSESIYLYFGGMQERAQRAVSMGLQCELASALVTLNTSREQRFWNSPLHLAPYSARCWMLPRKSQCELDMLNNL